MMMAADLDQAYARWAHEEMSDPTRPPHEKSIAQMLDHGSISFGRFAIESLSWEKRSVFNHNRRQEELEKFKAPGLVAQKKAYFEEYYRKIRTLKALADDSQQVGDAMEGTSDEIHTQTAEDAGCETSLMSTKSLTDVSTVSADYNYSYENPEKPENHVRTGSGHFDSEATSPSNSLGKTDCVIELERNISDVSQVTHLESDDALMPFIVLPKASEVELENHSSNVSQITQIDSDSMEQFLDLSEANLNEIGAVHFEAEPNTTAFHLNLEENHLLTHEKCGERLLDNENDSAITEINMRETMVCRHPSEFCGVSQLPDVDHKMSEPSGSDFMTEPKGILDPSEEPTKIVTRPPDTVIKVSTAASSMSRETSNRPVTSRSLHGISIQQESGSLARNRMNQGPINRPGSSRSRQVLRQNQEFSISARVNLNQVPNNRSGSSRSVQGLGNQQQSGTLARNNTNQGSSNRPGSSRSLRPSSNQHGFGTLASNSMNQGPGVSSRPGSSRSLQGLGNQQQSGTLARNSMNQGSSNRPGSSRSFRVSSNQHGFGPLASNSMNQGPSVGNRPGSSRSLQGLGNQQQSGTLARNSMNQGSSNRPGSSRSLRVSSNQHGFGTLASNSMNQEPSVGNRPGSSRSLQGLGNQQQSVTLARNNMNQGSSNRPGSSRSLRVSSNQHGFGTLASNPMNQGPSVNNRPGSSRSLQGLGKRPSSSRSFQRPINVLNKTGEEEEKVARSSNRNKMPASDISSCTVPKDVHSKVTVPQPFSFASEKRATAEIRISDIPHKKDRHDDSYNHKTARLSSTPFQTRSLISSVSTPRKTASELGVKENRHQDVPQKSLLQSQHTFNGDRHLKAPMHWSINLPSSDTSHSTGKCSSRVGNSTRLDQKEEKHVKTPAGKSKQSFSDGGALIRTPKSETRKVVSSQPTPAGGDKKTPRQEVKRWR